MRPMVLAEPHDISAARVVAHLRRRGVRPIVAGGTELALACWDHRIDRSGNAVSRVRLSSGEEVRSEDVSAALVRLQYIGPLQFARSGPDDRNYAAQELHALMLSFLAGLRCPVLNPPHPTGLAGADVKAGNIARAARRVGLDLVREAQRRRADAHDRQAVLVVGSRSVAGDEVSGAIAQRCVELATALNLSLVRFAFDGGSRGRLLVVDTFPELTMTNAAEVAAELDLPEAAE